MPTLRSRRNLYVVRLRPLRRILDVPLLRVGAECGCSTRFEATEEDTEGADDPRHTAVTQEPLASRLLRILAERPGNYTIEELRAELRASKTAIRMALADLEEAGNIQIDEGE